MAIAVALVASAADLKEDSPFLPPGGGEVAPEPPAEPRPTLANLEFAGVMSFGQGTLISVHNLQTDKGVWIPLGAEEEGIRVLSYNAEAQEVTIVSMGVTAVLKLREAKFGGGSWIKPLPTLEQEYGRPLTVKEQETEARMLVSDLLEIGMKERERQRELRNQQRAPSKQR
jgi:hypothetical protein